MSGTNETTQIFIVLGSSDVYIRTRSSNAWSSWVKPLINVELTNTMPTKTGLYYLSAAQTVGNVTIPIYCMGIALFYSTSTGGDGLFIGQTIGASSVKVRAQFRAGEWTDAWIETVG